MQHFKNRLFKIMVMGLPMLAVGCSPKHATVSQSQVSIQFPSAQEFSQSTGASSLKSAGLKAQAGMKSTLPAFDFAQACFAVNVTAPDIAFTKANTCSVPIGIFQGFVAPASNSTTAGAASNSNGMISMSIPSGTGRTLEIFAYLRASSADACPTNATGLQGLDISRLTRVGLMTFDATTATVALSVTLQDPGTQTLVTQYSLPSTCEPPPAPVSSSSAAIAAGRATSSGGNYMVIGTVSGLQNEVSLQGGKYQIRLSRSAQ